MQLLGMVTAMLLLVTAMQQAVMVQCGLPEPPSPPDVADAIAIALCAGRREHLEAAPAVD